MINPISFNSSNYNPDRHHWVLRLLPFAKTIKIWLETRKIIKELDRYEARGFDQNDFKKDVLEGKITVLERISQKIKSSSLINKRNRLALDRRIIALSCRAGIAANSPKENHSHQAQNLASRNLCLKGVAYKAKTYSILEEEKGWGEKDKAVIRELEKFPGFAHHLTENTSLQESFFEWTLLHRMPVDIFVKYATVTDVIPQVALRHIATACKDDGLKECRDLNGRVQLKIKCKAGEEELFINVLDSSTKLAFAGHEDKTIGYALNQFPKASSADRDYQFFKDGLHAWNTGAYTPVLDEVRQPNSLWWAGLPVFKTLSNEEASKRYGEGCEGLWIMSPRVVHSSDSLDQYGNHSYLEIAIPQGNGTYNIYPFGRDPVQDPKGIFQILSFLGKTVEGRVVYLDQGASYTERRNSGIAYALDEEKGLALMESIRQDIADSLDEKVRIPFQLIGENCAKWVQDKVSTIQGAEDDLFGVEAAKIGGICHNRSDFEIDLMVTFFGGHRTKEINGKKMSVFQTIRGHRLFHPTKLHQEYVDHVFGKPKLIFA